DKIVLMTHMQQLRFERELAPLLSGVDILIGGGSNSILADEDDRLRPGDEAVDTYPIWDTGANGDPIAIVNTDGSWRYVGRLVIGFDNEGILIPSTYDPQVSGAFAADEQGVEAVDGDPNALVEEIANTIRDVL